MCSSDLSQPRVPRGSSGGGQWTGGGGARTSTGIVLSDVTPDNFSKPGSQVAQAGSRGRSSYALRIGTQTFEATPAQAVRYTVAETEARALTSQVRQVDPNWRPTPSLTETIEGEIGARRAEAEQARAKLAELSRLPPKDLMAAYRSANNSYDLFGRETWPRDQGTVSVTTLNRTPIFGVNSSAPTYTTEDRAEAQTTVGNMIKNASDIMNRDNIGGKPNDALYHAEANVLMRAARGNGGLLTDQRIEAHTDRPMCGSCKLLLPRLGLELGNPTVTFVSPNGVRSTMQDGYWQSLGKR